MRVTCIMAVKWVGTHIQHVLINDYTVLRGTHTFNLQVK